MQAIKTRYLPPTNFKGSRIKAECEAGDIIIPYNYSYQVEALHRFAVFELLHKLGWNPIAVHTGELKDCYVHVLEFGNNLDTKHLPELLKDQA